MSKNVYSLKLNKEFIFDICRNLKDFCNAALPQPLLLARLLPAAVAIVLSIDVCLSNKQEINILHDLLREFIYY